MKKLDSKGFSHHLLLPIVVVLLVAGIGVWLLFGAHAQEIPKNTVNPNTDGSQTITYYWDSDASGCAPSNNQHNCGVSVIGHDSGYDQKSQGNIRDSWVAAATATNRDQNFPWFGPYRTMTVPSGYSGVVGCFRWMVNSQVAPGSTNVIDIDLMSNNGHHLLASKRFNVGNEYDANLANPTTHLTCLKSSNYPTGTTFHGVEARVTHVGVTGIDPTGKQSIYFGLIRTNLAFY